MRPFYSYQMLLDGPFLDIFYIILNDPCSTNLHVQVEHRVIRALAPYVCKTFAQMVRKGESTQEEILNICAGRGWLKLACWFISRGYSYDDQFLALLAQQGRKDILLRLEEQGKPINEGVILGALLGGNLEILQWMKEKYFPTLTFPNSYRLMEFLLRGKKRKRTILWLTQTFPSDFEVFYDDCSSQDKIKTMAFHQAALEGDLKLIQWLDRVYRSCQ